jgi:hypothetical protein
MWREAVVTWRRAPPQSEALVELGRLHWALDEREAALTAFDRAVDASAVSAQVFADVVSFLVQREQYERAADAYHRALGHDEVGDYFKVYMSLWVLAAARRAGRPADPLAVDYLTSRTGALWHDQLAGWAVGRVDDAALAGRATTRGRRAELLYYRAVLREDDPARARALLRRVLETDMLLYFEYEMALGLLAAVPPG